MRKLDPIHLAPMLGPFALGARILMLGFRVAVVLVVGHEALRPRAPRTPEPVPFDSSLFPVEAATDPPPIVDPPPVDPPVAPVEPRTMTLDLDDVTMATRNVGWALVSTDDLYDLARTEDGAKTFRVLGPDRFARAAFVDASTAFVAGPTHTSAIAVSRTTDGGASWVTRTIEVDGAWPTVNDLRFADARNGVLTLSERTDEDSSPLAVFVTTDGGSTWRRTPTATSFSVVPGAGSLWSVDATTNQLERAGWMSGASAIAPDLASCTVDAVPEFVGGSSIIAASCATGPAAFATDDGGAHWSRRGTIDVGTGAPLWLELVDARHAVAVSGRSLAFTADGGATWRRSDLDVDGSATITAVHAISSTLTLVAVDGLDGGSVFRTADDGTTLLRLPISLGSNDEVVFPAGPEQGLMLVEGPTGTDVYRMATDGTLSKVLPRAE